MRVHLGNAHAIEGFAGPSGLEFRPFPGERVTSFDIPDGLSTIEVVGVVQGGLRHLIAPGHAPAWIEADDNSLRILLCQSLGVDPDATRPESWGTTDPEV